VGCVQLTDAYEIACHTARVNRKMASIIKQDRGETMAEIILRIDGMHCGSCVRRVSQALASTEGITVNEVRVGAARLTPTAEPARVEQAIAALAKAGFPAHLEQ
jgi:copper chaperone